VVIIADAYTLPPAVAHQTGFPRDVRKCSIAIVFVEMVGGLPAFRKILQPPPVDHEKIQPPVVVVVEERDSPARRGKQEVFVLMANNDGLGQKTGFLGEVGIAREVFGLGGRKKSCGRKRTQDVTQGSCGGILEPPSSIHYSHSKWESRRQARLSHSTSSV